MMKFIKLFSIIIAFSVIACNQQTDKHSHEGHSHDGEEAHVHAEEEALPSTGNFGDEISSNEAIAVAEVITLLGEQDSVSATISGTIVSACQVSGCWMDLDLGDDERMKITFKDYGFFVPKDAAGKTAIAEGYAYRELIDVETLRHYAEDEGLSKEEIEAITEPEMLYTFVASGVVIQE